MNSEFNAECLTLSFDEGFKKLMDRGNAEAVSQVGIVHSVFNKVINFKDHKNQLHSLLHRDMDNGPYSIRVDRKGSCSFQDFLIHVNDAVYMSKDYLVIGNLFKLKLSRSRLWQPQPIKLDLNRAYDLLNKNIERYNQYLLVSGSSGGVKHYYLKNHLHLPVKHHPTLIEKELEKRILNFRWSVQNNGQALEEHINALLGFGNGLTPSGDDFLAGYILALNTVQRREASKILRKIKGLLGAQKLPTTDISITMLKATLEGKTREYIHQFICSLFDDDDSRMIRNTEQVLAIGSSSGTDLSIGISVGLSDFLEDSVK
ncbi:DUF2877 domain-containing protein [Bacillus horti]|uniref:DUF2877 domain-containing protein n=1 Tax=Caldalkalibacillus horti TaxID=77523 RepID=A0ABT9W3P2_9BACI|nr:DUF2877 domain-containing protein [Bacillus horti]MDQ0167735.1 hypothetical protein [Bacillus horti]